MQASIITVLGAGYVGLTTAVLFANAGYKTYLVEPNAKRRESITKGKAFFYEDGIDALLQAALARGMLVVDNKNEGIKQSDFIFSCVGTPDNTDGTINLSYVVAAAQETATHIKQGAVYIQKSTVPVGTGKRLEQILITNKDSVAYVSNPEFLREGTAIIDTLFADRVVTGGRNQDANIAVSNLYKVLSDTTPSIVEVAGLISSPDMTNETRYFSTNLESAELIKVTANAFLALKISFANSIAKLSDTAGADITEVMDAVGIDKRIGRSFLNAGRGYGGGCFPKDVAGLISSSAQLGIEMPILSAAQLINESMPQYVVDRLQQKVGTLSKKRITLLGLAFKAGTSDVRKSPGLVIAGILGEAGAIIKAHDPAASEDAHRENALLVISDSIKEAITGSAVVIIATEWKEYATAEALTLYKQCGIQVVVDAVNILNPDTVKECGLIYIGVGRS